MLEGQIHTLYVLFVFKPPNLTQFCYTASPFRDTKMPKLLSAINDPRMTRNPLSFTLYNEHYTLSNVHIYPDAQFSFLFILYILQFYRL